MGFRLSKSFKLAPGVRMTLSKSGIGYSAGGKGARITRTARGRTVGRVGIPGSGISYSKTLTSRRSSGEHAKTTVKQQQLPRPSQVKPGLLAPKAEKELYKALIEEKAYWRLEKIATKHPAWRSLCATLDGLFAYQAENTERAEPALLFAFQSNLDASTHPFMQKYISTAHVTLEVAEGVEVSLPLGREAVGLTLAEIYQGSGRLDQAIAVVEQLEPTFSAAVSLAELYSEAGRQDDVIELTNDLTNETDAHAFLLILRARAMREKGLLDSSKDVLKEAMRRRNVDSEIRRRAYLERANTYLLQNRRAQARKDLERIFAEDADYPGLREAMAALDADIKTKDEGK